MLDTWTEISQAVSLSELASRVQGEGREVLEELVGDSPVFVIRPRGKQDGQVLFNTPPGALSLPDTQKWGEELSGKETHSAGLAIGWAGFDALSPVVPVRKSERNPFLGLITVGRASNNDLRLASRCVSKLHAFVKATPDGWKVQDCDSSNGTFINHIRLESKVDYWLSHGDELQFGDVTGMFLDAAGLTALCQILRL